MVEMQVDPMEPPKFQHKKVSRVQKGWVPDGAQGWKEKVYQCLNCKSFKYLYIRQ